MTACELLATCGFFQKYQKSLDLACKGFIRTYCNGSKMDECKRKLYRREHGTPPGDNMLPTGQMLPKDYC
jgi:hypothetical protein